MSRFAPRIESCLIYEERRRRSELTEEFRDLYRDVYRNKDVKYVDGQSEIVGGTVVISDLFPKTINIDITASRLLILDPMEHGVELCGDIDVDFAVIKTKQLKLWGDMRIERGILLCDNITHYIGKGTTNHLCPPNDADKELLEVITDIVGEKFVSGWDWFTGKIQP